MFQESVCESSYAQDHKAVLDSIAVRMLDGEGTSATRDVVAWLDSTRRAMGEDAWWREIRAVHPLMPAL